jgi:hypothetical protein
VAHIVEKTDWIGYVERPVAETQAEHYGDWDDAGDEKPTRGTQSVGGPWMRRFGDGLFLRGRCGCIHVREYNHDWIQIAINERTGFEA